MVLIITFGFSFPLFANSILYRFSTSGGVVGSFTLDDSTPFHVTTEMFSSPILAIPEPLVTANSEQGPISGSFGEYSFSGSANILRRDFLAPYDSAWDEGQRDWWILHSSLSSQIVLGRSLTGLHLLDYVFPQTDMGSFFAPPPGDVGNMFNFSYR